MAKKDFIRTQPSSSRIVEADLKVSGSFMLPLVESNDDPQKNAIAVQEDKIVKYSGVEWEEIGGGLDADAIDETLEINSDGILGVNLDQVTSREDFNALRDALIPHPKYDYPQASLSANQSITGEIGYRINNLEINAGFNQRDGGQAYGFQIRKNGDTAAVGASFTDSIVLTAGAINYQGVVFFYDGPVKKNILNMDDPTGRILAGSAFSNVLTAIGFYATWYGPATATPANRNDAVALGGKQFTNASNNFILNTGITRTLMAIITAPGKSLQSVVDLDALNAVITSEYVLQGNITINDTAGNAVTGYKLYLKTMGVPYSSSHRHQISLG